MQFCTVINCIDGRTQLPVITYAQNRFDSEYVDIITEAGPNLLLFEQKDRIKVQSIIERLEISIKKHHSAGIAIVGHHDCAGNPAPKREQIDHLLESVRFVQDRFKQSAVIGIWVNENWIAQEI